jgi:SdpI/YfhL protein family
VTIAAVAMAIGGSVVVAVGRAGRRGLLSPNAWVGIRTKTTMSSYAAWYTAHEAGGKWISVGGWIIAIGGMLLLLVRPGEDVALRIALATTLVGAAVVLYGGWVGHNAAIALPDPDEWSPN